MSEVHDPTECALGEGPLWHPGRGQLYWFDILNHTLLTREVGETQRTTFDTYVSAAGWVDQDRFLVASAKALHLHDLITGATEDLVPLEADNPVTRSNDGRADPWGGFWIGTMGIEAEEGAGAIYRYYRGEVRKLYAPITISNAICFSPDRRFAYFTDTPTQVIQRVALAEKDGWPSGDPEPWLDLSKDNWRPDGAVCDAQGNLWNAQWGGFRVACYSSDGSFIRAVKFPAAQTTCPAFGGTTLYCTSAATGLSDVHREQHPLSGQTFAATDIAEGQLEHQVIL